MRVVLKEGDVIIGDWSFENEAVYAGSQPGCAVHLPDRQIPGHLLLLAPDEEGNWWVELLSPGAPVRMGGADLTERRLLAEGDQIVIHDYLLHIYLQDEAAAREAADERLSPTDLAEIRKYPLPAGSFIKRPGDPVKLEPGQITRLSRTALDIGRCRDIHQLVEVSLTSLLQSFRGRCAWIGLRREPRAELEVVGGRYASGEPSEAPELCRRLRYRCLDRSQMILVRRAEDEIIGSALAAPIATSLGNLGMVYVDVRKSTRRLNTSDLDAFVVLASQIGTRLEVLLREQVRMEAEVSNSELNVLHGIQERLDPLGIPMWKSYQVAAFSMAGTRNAGDVYDVMTVPGKDAGGLLIAHVHAEGALLALLMAQVHASFRMAVLHQTPPHVFLRQLNYLLYGTNEFRYVACFVLMVDPGTAVVQHCRAGRIGAVIVNSRGEPRPFGAIEVPAVGVEKGFEYTMSEDQLAPGETLALYTRGVTTALSATGERFREKRFIDCLCDGFGQPAAATMADLKADLTSFIAGGSHPDDMTILLLHRVARD